MTNKMHCLEAGGGPSMTIVPKSRWFECWAELGPVQMVLNQQGAPQASQWDTLSCLGCQNTFSSHNKSVLTIKHFKALKSLLVHPKAIIMLNNLQQFEGKICICPWRPEPNQLQHRLKKCQEHCPGVGGQPETDQRPSTSNTKDHLWTDLEVTPVLIVRCLYCDIRSHSGQLYSLVKTIGCYYALNLRVSSCWTNFNSNSLYIYIADNIVLWNKFLMLHYFWLNSWELTF